MINPEDPTLRLVGVEAFQCMFRSFSIQHAESDDENCLGSPLCVKPFWS